MLLQYKTGFVLLFAIISLGYASYQLYITGGSRNGFMLSVAAIFILAILSVWLCKQILTDLNRARISRLEILTREAKYRQLIEDAGVVMYTTDNKGIFTFVSNKTASLTGFTKEEALGKHFSFVVAPDHIQEVTEFYVRQFLSGTPELSLQFPILTKDKQEKWVEQHSVLIWDEGVITGFQCIVKDVTEQKRAADQLLAAENQRREYEARTQAIFDHAPLMIYIKDLSGNYLFTNKHFKELCACKEADDGKSDNRRLQRENTELHRATDARLLETLQPVEMEEKLWIGGEQKNHLLVKFPMFDGEGNLFATSGIATDVTDRVRFREQLILTNQKAAAAEKEKEDIFSRISYEIRSPLKGILDLMELVSQSSFTAPDTDKALMAEASYRRLLRLSDDIDYILKIKAGTIKVASIHFSPEHVMEEAAALFRNNIDGEEIEVITGIHPDVPSTIAGDPSLLTAVFSNLFRHALRLTKKGYIQAGIFPGKQPRVLQIVVRDSGQVSGAEENASSPNTIDTEELDGSEMALPLAKQLIALQKGTMEITSADGAGTTCRFFLPYEYAERKLPVAGLVEEIS